MMKNSRKIVVILVSIILIFVIGIIVKGFRTEKGGQKVQNKVEISKNKEPQEATSENSAVNERDTQVEKQTADKQEVSEKEKKTDENKKNNRKNGDENKLTEKESLPESTEKNTDENTEENTNITLPFTIPGTELVIDHIDSYTGVFVEDGSDEKVEDIFAIHILNNSNQNVEYSEITVSINGTDLLFKVSGLPAGAGISVLESNRTTYEEGTLTYIDNQTAYVDDFNLLENEIGTVIEDDNGITVTNLTKEDIPCVRLFYKFVSEDEEYLGGITYTAKIKDLKAGDNLTIYPSHFAKDGSEIIMVRTYDTAE